MKFSPHFNFVKARTATETGGLVTGWSEQKFLLMWSRSCVSAQRAKLLFFLKKKKCQINMKTVQNRFIRQIKNCRWKSKESVLGVLTISADLCWQRGNSCNKTRRGLEADCLYPRRAPSAKLFYSSVGKTGVCVSAEQGALRVTFSW